QVSASDLNFSVSGISVPLTLAPGQSVAVAVTFAPTSSGADSGSVSIIVTVSTSGGGHKGKGGHSLTAAASTSTTATVAVSGTGVMTGQLAAAPASIDFGKVQINSSPQVVTGTLTNSGGTSVNINTATITGAGFTLSGLSSSLALAPGGSVSFSVSFAPQTSGAVSGNIAVISDASDPTMNVPLSGTGATPGTLGANPGSLSFGNVQVGSSQTLQETVSNSGGSSVTITQANVPSGFTVTGLTLPATVGAGQSTSFSVKFSPQAGGPASGNLSIISDASNPTLGVSLSGSGTTPGSLAASPASLSFGTVQVGDTKSLQETLTNSGGSTVSVTQANSTNAAFVVSGLTLPLTLGAGQSASFNVSFNPQSGGPASGKVSVLSDASNSTLDISLS